MLLFLLGGCLSARPPADSPGAVPSAPPAAAPAESLATISAPESDSPSLATLSLSPADPPPGPEAVFPLFVPTWSSASSGGPAPGGLREQTGSSGLVTLASCTGGFVQEEGAAPPPAAWPSLPCRPSLRSLTPPPDPFCGSLGPWIWGIVGLRAFPAGDTMAANGYEFNQLFSVDLDFNMWIWQRRRVYFFNDDRFWAQKATPGVTNPHQGAFDFSKREYDFTGGVAWNYYGFWEARTFAYSYNNLNRGDSPTTPTGFADGVGIENRYYLNQTYAVLGTPAFDKARNTFVSVGYYPSKTMIDGRGYQFRPGAFARAYLIWQLLGPRLYLFTDDILTCERAGAAKLFYTDTGVAFRPVPSVPRLEFRVGTEDTFDLQVDDVEASVYCSMRFIY